MTIIITTDDLRAHLNLPAGQDEALLASKIAAAQGCVENFTGYGLTETCDEPLKEAVRQLAAHFYENREGVLVGATAQPLPYGVWDLLAPYRSFVF